MPRFEDGAYNRLQFLRAVSRSVGAHTAALQPATDRDSNDNDDDDDDKQSTASTATTSTAPCRAAAKRRTLVPLSPWSQPNGMYPGSGLTGDRVDVVGVFP